MTNKKRLERKEDKDYSILESRVEELRGKIGRLDSNILLLWFILLVFIVVRFTVFPDSIPQDDNLNIDTYCKELGYKGGIEEILFSGTVGKCYNTSHEPYKEVLPDNYKTWKKIKELEE